MKFNWRYKKFKLKRKYSSISDKDLKYTIGKEKELLERLREKLGKTNKEILDIIIEL
jgi:hypothetical protein